MNLNTHISYGKMTRGSKFGQLTSKIKWREWEIENNGCDVWKEKQLKINK